MMASVSQNWPNWVALLSIVLLSSRVTKGVLERWYRGLRSDQDRAHGVLERMADTLERYSKTILDNQVTILATINSTSKSSNDYMLTAIREMATNSNEATGGILLALGRKEAKTVEAIESLARAIRDDLAALRSPPPVGGTGSQVKDSGGPG
jgi:hypothetical protein